MRLKTLRLKKSHSKIPAEILYEDYTHLEIFGGALEMLPAELFCKPNLQVLKIKNAGLAQLPESLTAPAGPDLHTLILQQNQLRTLPSWLYQLSALKTLDVGHNLLEVLPLKFPPQLARLGLQSNCLKELPEEIFHLKSLLHLSLDDNPLSAALVQRLYETFGIWSAS